jgi:hypothetical protein
MMTTQGRRKEMTEADLENLERQNWLEREAFFNQFQDEERAVHDDYDDEDDGDDSWEDIAGWCLSRLADNRLTDWDRQFVKGMVIWIRSDKEPTRKQARRLEIIFETLQRKSRRPTG